MDRLATLSFVVCTVVGARAAAERPPLEIYLSPKDFDQIADKRQVKVYKHKSSDIIRIGAVGTFPAPPARVRDALLDYRRQLGRIARLSEARVLRRGERSLVVYQRLNLPVISDRDFVLDVRWGADGERLWTSYRTTKALGPAPRSGIVRVPTHRGTWELTPIKGGAATRVRFQVSIDLSGWLPRWMARAGAGKELPDLFGAICRLSRPDGRVGKCP